MKRKLLFGWLFRIFAIVLLITPLLILTIVKKDTWFIYGANKVSIGFIVALLFVVMMVKGAFKNLDQRLTTIITLLTLSIIVWLFDTIIDDMFAILICSTIGYVLYIVCDSLGARLLKTYNIYFEENVRNNVRVGYTTQVKGSGRA